jgi:hypothetical protein
MRHTGLSVVLLVTLILSSSEEIRAQSVTRVRSADPAIASLIARASELSPTFRGFLDTIDHSDGIVYVQHGRCRHGVANCMPHDLTVAGPNRILHIVIGPRRSECETTLMASIGHELWHAIEVLREPTLRSYAHLYRFYERMAVHHTNRIGSIGAWETHDAIKAGQTVLGELQRSVRQCGKSS